MKTKNQSSLPSKYWLIIVIVICVILMGVERITGGNGPISFIANYTVIPMQKGIGYVGRYMSDLSDNFETLQDMKKENKKLQSKVDDLTIDNTRLRQDQYELERLRELYKLDENYSDYKKIGAHVISNSGSNWFSDFTIDKGSKDGIKKNCNVLAGSGLVGIVTEVGPHYARVRSIIDDESNISAMLLSTSDTCVVRGDLKQMENGRIRFEKLANNDNKIEVGEQVVTSHVSDRFLQGLFIGYVSDVKVDSNNLTRSGYITPVVDFSKLHEVLVITTTKSELIKQEYISGNRLELTFDMPLGEIVIDFYDKLKSISKGYASFDYHLHDFRESRLVKLDILLNGESVDALSTLTHADNAVTFGRRMCEKLKELIPRQQFDIAIQAAIGAKIIARETIKAVRKDVTAKCYGGDISRKRKLLEKQKKGKKRMKQIGSVEVPQKAFLAVLKLD